MARRTTTPRSSQGTKWHPVNNHLSPYFSEFQPNSYSVTTPKTYLPFAGAISAAARRNGCSEQVLEQFSTQKVQRSDFFCVYTWKTEEKWRITCEILRGPIRKFVWDCLLRLSWEENWSAGPIPSQEGRKRSRCHQCSVWTRFPAASNALTTKCHFVIRERRSHQNTIHLFVNFQTLNNWQMQGKCCEEWKCKSTQGLCTCAGRKKLTNIEISSVLSIFVVETADPFLFQSELGCLSANGMSFPWTKL